VKRVVFHPQAEAEMQAAAEFYETKRRGLGADFIGEVERATEALVAYSRIGHRFSRRLRRVLVHRFPYGLLYRVDRDWIFVVAVAHVRRRPGYWRTRQPA
jgi:plasmid stabilization system protein ParE